MHKKYFQHKYYMYVIKLIQVTLAYNTKIWGAKILLQVFQERKFH